MYATENKITGWNLVIAFSALFIGGLFGPLQKLQGIGLNAYPTLSSLGIKTYYQGLTIHGVLNALVFTTFFILGFFTYAISRSLEREQKYPWLHWLSFILMTLGLLAAAVPILGNLATVLYTFYPPMEASFFFYLGLTLVVVGSWLGGWGFYLTYWQWRKDNPGERTPFIALASIITMVMWQIATLGVATEILFQIISWTLGWVEGIDPQLARTFFWFFGILLFISGCFRRMSHGMVCCPSRPAVRCSVSRWPGSSSGYSWCFPYL
jgi:cytochrome c oxidase subunit 1